MTTFDGFGTFRADRETWMNRFTTTAALFCALNVVSGNITAFAEEQTKFDLQPGYYVYLGTQPGRTAPKGFTINSTGTVFWQDPNKVQDGDEKSIKWDPPPRTVKPAAKPVVSAQASSPEIESYNYPLIKWRAKAISTIPGAIAQLTTTFEQGYDFGHGQVKYKLVLFKAPSQKPVQKPASSPTSFLPPPIDNKSDDDEAFVPRKTIDVQILDQNGFLLTSFSLGPRAFEQIAGTSVWEGRGQIGWDELHYRQARDYSVK